MTTLVTGGTGSFGKAYLQAVGGSVRVLSRDEEKQRRLAQLFPDVEFVIGDIRDRDAVRRAMRGCDRVFHAAALKQVPQAEANPGEYVRTNIVGTENVCLIAQELDAFVVTLSTDKAVEPAGVMGATKFLAERLTTSYNFNAVRYGNIVGSRGSIVPVFRRMVAEDKPITITDPTMTRFVITLAEAVELVQAAMLPPGGRVYVRKSPSATVEQMVRVIAPGHPTVVTGARLGEKWSEDLVATHEHVDFEASHLYVLSDGQPSNQRYSSRTAPRLTDDELALLISQAPDDL
jgi:FlaA1/EpsC-like NDP-sugar epimerase